MTRIRINTVRSRRQTFRQRPKERAKLVVRRDRPMLEKSAITTRFGYFPVHKDVTPDNDNWAIGWQDYYED